MAAGDDGPSRSAQQAGCDRSPLPTSSGELFRGRTGRRRSGLREGAGMWGKRDDMIVHDEEPFNAEPPPASLAGQPVTPIEAFYSRNHGPFPDLDPASWRLRV